VIAQWDSLQTGLSMAQAQFRSISRDLSLADHMGCPVHSSGSIKELSGWPLEKSLQYYEDHEMPTDQPGLWQKRNQHRYVTAI